MNENFISLEKTTDGIAGRNRTNANCSSKSQLAHPFRESSLMGFTCYLCGNKGFSIIADKDLIRFNCYGFNKRILRCSKCGLLQLYPQWTGNELENLYSRYSKKKDFKNYKTKHTITPYLTKYIKKSDKILEIGCGSGDNIRRLNKKGYNVIGIDKDPTVCDGRLIFNYDFKDFNAKEKKYDFIYAIQVFEHVPDPKKFITWLTNSLEKNGRFLLELPNIDDPLLKIYNNKNFNKFYWYPYHLFFYNKNTIRNLFENFSSLLIKINLFQRYGLINHLRWIIFGKPGNINFHLPILDDIYKFVLTKLLSTSDTLIIWGKRNE